MRGSVADVPPAQERWAALGCRLVQGQPGPLPRPGACAARAQLGAGCLRFHVLGKLKKADDKKMKGAHTGSLGQSPGSSSNYSV